MNDIAYSALRALGDKPVVIAWYGRIDNRPELSHMLSTEIAAHVTEENLAAAAYLRWGVAGLARLLGDWSVVIADPVNHAVILASDYMGVRPLYYSSSNDALRWSTSLQAFVDGGACGLDERFAAGFLTLGGLPASTPYTGVSVVPPGAAVVLSRRTVVEQRFWNAVAQPVIRYSNQSDYEEHLRELFQEAVAVRLRPQTRAVMELSGGLDSSSIVCVATELIRSHRVAPRELGTVSYTYDSSLDTRFSQLVTRTCRVPSVELSVHEHPLMALEDPGEAMPESWLPLRRAVLEVMRRSGSGVLMTGLGGDLMMGNWIDDSLQVAGHLRSGHVGRAWNDALGWSRALQRPLWQIFGRALQATLLPATLRRGLYSFGATSTRPVDDSVRQDFVRKCGLKRPSRLFSRDWLHAPPERRKHVLALTMLRELRALRRPELFEGIDYTHPFTHRPLVEFIMRIPARVLCAPGEPRRLMRRAFQEFWPTTLAKRRSKGLFTEPWVQALLQMTARLGRGSRWQVVERGWVDSASLSTRLDRLSYGLACDEAQLRQIILLECWLRKRRERVKLSSCAA